MPIKVRSTYECECDRCGFTGEIQGDQNDAFLAGWSRMIHHGAVQTTMPVPLSVPGAGDTDPVPSVMIIQTQATTDMCPTCTGEYKTWYSLKTPPAPAA